MLTIPPDYTFVIQIALTVVLWVVLKRIWFDPALAVIHERQKRSEGAVKEAQVVQAEAERLRREHAAALEQAKAEAQREVQEILRTAQAEHKRIVDAATEDAHKLLAEARAGIAAEVATARKALDAEIDGIAREVARVVTGRVMS